MRVSLIVTGQKTLKVDGSGYCGNITVTIASRHVPQIDIVVSVQNKVSRESAVSEALMSVDDFAKEL